METNRLFLSPNDLGTRTIYKRKKKICFSQEIQKFSPTPKRAVKSMPGKFEESRKKISDTYLVSVGKKSKLECGESQYFYIQNVNSYTGKTVYHKFFHDFKVPNYQNFKIEPENLLTDDSLIEYTVNSIRKWIENFCNE